MGKRALAIAAVAVTVATALFFLLLPAKPPPVVPPAEQSGSAATELRFGANLELSGKFAARGVAARQGIELALQEINAGGGLLGKPVRLTAIDNQSDETTAPNVFQQLTQHDVCGVIGPLNSTTAIAAAQQADLYKTPFIAILATNPRVTIDDSGRVRPFAFRACFIDPFQGTAMADFALTTLHARNAAIYIDDSAYYSQGLASFFEAAFVQRSGRIAIKAGYSPQSSDFAQNVASLLAEQPDVLFIPGYYSEVAKIVALARQQGFAGPIIGGDGWEEQLLVQAIRPELLNNTFYCSHYSPDDSTLAVQQFIQRYRAAMHNEEPMQAAIIAYDATMLLADAIRRAGSADHEAVRTALAQTKNYPAVTGTLSIDDRHNAQKAAVIIALRDGKGRFLQRIYPPSSGKAE